MLKLALIGCGAIAEAHLKAAIASGRIEPAILVDQALARARKLADKYGVPRVTANHTDVVGQVDSAIVALPHHLHAPVAIDLLGNGIHVLVEKPMALNARECDEMIAAAHQTGSVLAVGLIRRYYPSAEFVKNAIDGGLLGDIVRFDARLGSVFNWPVASDFTFRKETGGGALGDAGAHALDILLWWLGDHESLEYFDDAAGGVEADCELHLKMKNGAACIVELSRTRDLRNTFVIEGTKATLEVDASFDPLVSLTAASARNVVFAGRCNRSGEAAIDPEKPFREQVADWAAAILNKSRPRVTGEEGRRSVALIESCYANRRPLICPWISITSLLEQ